MPSPLGIVTVTAVTIVKAVAVIGAVVAGYHLACAAVALIAGGGAAAYTDAAVSGLGFLAGIAGFELAEWAGGKVKTIEAKEQQQAVLRRLEARHGVAL